MAFWKQLGKWSSEAHLLSLPEMSRFPDEATRQRAVDELNRGFYTWRIVPALLIQVVAIWCVFYLTVYAIRMLAPSMLPWSGWIGVVTSLLLYVVFLAWALPRGLVQDVRKKLLAAGVPVCLKCGYDLRGQPAGSDRCPECGTRSEVAES